jgi:hypothetical protein
MPAQIRHAGAEILLLTIRPVNASVCSVPHTKGIEWDGIILHFSGYGSSTLVNQDRNGFKRSVYRKLSLDLK